MPYSDKNSPNLISILERVRLEFEKKKVPKQILAQLYIRYNPTVDGDLFVAEAEKMFPRLNCGLASVYLRQVLGGDIVRGKYGEHDHTFLMLDGQVVDITADQYGGPKVYVGNLCSPWARE